MGVEIVHWHQRYSLLLRIFPGSRRDVLVTECRLDGDQKLQQYALLTGRHSYDCLEVIRDCSAL